METGRVQFQKFTVGHNDYSKPGQEEDWVSQIVSSQRWRRRITALNPISLKPKKRDAKASLFLGFNEIVLAIRFPLYLFE